jgi:hypothetical protein
MSMVWEKIMKQTIVANTTLLLAAGLVFVLAGCEGVLENDQAETKSGSSQQVTEAILDLSGRLGVQDSDVRLIVERNVTWRDGSLGCPEEDMMYTQALVEGSLILLRVDDVEYEYHSGGGRAPFYCENPVNPTPKSSAE